MIVGWQEWHELLFVHFRIEAARLRPLVHRRLDVEEHDGSAWISFTPFTLQNGRLRGLPPLPDFHELNLRTYVRGPRGSGIWFFSLDAASLPAVLAARATIRLPYFHARMERTEGWYRSERTGSDARFEARFSVGDEIPAKSPLEIFLCERYRLYSRGIGPVLFTETIEHEPWRLRRARIERLDQTLSDAAGIGAISGEPSCQYATPGAVVAFHPFVPC